MNRAIIISTLLLSFLLSFSLNAQMLFGSMTRLNFDEEKERLRPRIVKDLKKIHELFDEYTTLTSKCLSRNLTSIKNLMPKKGRVLKEEINSIKGKIDQMHIKCLCENKAKASPIIYKMSLIVNKYPKWDDKLLSIQFKDKKYLVVVPVNVKKSQEYLKKCK